MAQPSKRELYLDIAILGIETSGGKKVDLYGRPEKLRGIGTAAIAKVEMEGMHEWCR